MRRSLLKYYSSVKCKARVVGTRRSNDAAFLGVAVALAVPNETFWGVNFLLRKTSADLANIEQAIASGGVDPRLLREFREAVDYVRKAAWVVQEWQERQKHDPHTVLPMLTAERIRRATQLNQAIATDLAAHELTSDTVGLEELFQAVESLYQRVADLRKDGEA